MLRIIQTLSQALRILNVRLGGGDYVAETMRACISLGGVYIKFVQMLASHDTTKHLTHGVGVDIIYEQVPY